MALTCAALIGVIFLMIGLHVHLLKHPDAMVQIAGLFTLLGGLAIMIMATVCNFIILWDDEKPKETEKKPNLDTLQEVEVEEVN